MDAVVYGALEEICAQGANGVTLRELWTKIHSHLSSNGLQLCTNVKKALWSNLLNIPSLRFECNGVTYSDKNPKIQSVEDSEAIHLKIIAAEHLINSFFGIYDIQSSDAGISDLQRRVLARLAIARTEGVAQNQIAKEFGIENNYLFYHLKGLESRGLIVRQSTIIRKKEAGNELEHKQALIVNTNMLYLHRFAKHLGNLQRLEITKEENSLITDNNNNADNEFATGDGVSEERINDFVPAIKAICDLLEKADGKVLVVSDIKKQLGYCKSSGHRAWRNILQRMKEAHLVEDFDAIVNKKEVKCLRLLKNYSAKSCAPKNQGDGDDDVDTEQHDKPVKRGQITDQLMELPVEQQIYDLIDAEGPKGLTLTEVYKRLGINNKRYYPRILDMVSRFGMDIVSESCSRVKIYRVYTAGNYNSKVSHTTPVKSKDTNNDNKSSNHQEVMLPHSNQDVDVDVDVDDHTPTVDAEASEEHNIDDTSNDNTPIKSTSLNNLQNDKIADEEFEIENSTPVSFEKSSPKMRARRSYMTYPCLGLTTEHSQREQWIVEKLEEEKVLIRFELHRLLESLKNHEKEHKVQMDKKTLARSLNRLQEAGHCKCISFAVPSVTNCGKKRTIDVILHPSVYNAKNLSDFIHNKLRLTEKQIRQQNSSQFKMKNKQIPVLNNVERIFTNVKPDTQAETAEAMKNNGFVLAKMVRAKLLHVFLWNYLTRLPDWDDVLSGNYGYEQTNPYSTCKLFELNAAIKAMPLELFLQVAGSTVKLESMVEKCSNGLCLSDLSKDEYKSLMGTRATALISGLIDILRRLKLIRLISGEEIDAPVGPLTTLTHSLELKPYIEEPVGTVLPSTGVDNSFDLRPHVRHDFVLATRKGVDEYWNTLEYCYAASDPKAALHAFPGSAVHEIFLSRSWASIRVMTARQRSELFKLVANEDTNKKISYKNCEKIAAYLNLTLEQVLRVFYDKRQKDKSPSGKRKRYPRKKKIKKETSVVEESCRLQLDKILTATEEEIFLLESQPLIDAQKEIADDDDDDMEVIEDENGGDSISTIHDCALSKLQSSRSKRFAWSEEKDRLLVIEYVKYRASRGVKYNRTDWTTLESLPAPPHTCRRRMSTLNRNSQFRKAIMRLCNMVSVRYRKHLQNSKNKMIIQDQNQTNELDIDGEWDDFENKDVKTLLDEVLKYKQIAKMDATKGARYAGGQQHEHDENNIGTSSTPINELKKDGEKRQTPARRSRARLPKSYVMLMNKVKDFGKQAHESLAVSNAIELFKLVFLSTAKDPKVPNLLSETLRRYSEHDLLIAFNYLRDKNFMVRGSEASNFVLSQQFLHNISSSPFPVNTGKRAVKMAKWLHEKETDLLDTEVYLSADLQCGDVLQLCVKMCSGELSLFPCLPDEGVGEIENLKKRKSDDNNNEVCIVEITKKPKLLDTEIFSRKEKGFPGIQLFLNCSTISRDENPIACSGSNLDDQLLPSEQLADCGAESAWEAMTCYARNLAFSGHFYPNMFKIVYFAIQKAGDQGLGMKGISEIIDVQGDNMAEVIVEVLEAFGRVLKVNAYDSVHVVDSLYRSKYLLTRMGSHQHDLDLDLIVLENSTNDIAKPLKSPQNHENESKNPATETSTDVEEEHGSNDGVHHRVTILNHPEEIPQPISEVQGNNETENYTNAKVMSPKTGPYEQKCEFRIDDSPSFRPILPWVNGDGSVNEIVYKGLVRRVLGIVMQNPGILEEHVLRQMNVLNPQSCRKLLELMILDNHITIRKMYQSISNEPPAILSRLLTGSKSKLICRQHLFANPTSINCL